MNNPESEKREAQEASEMELIEELVEELIEAPAEDPIKKPIKESGLEIHTVEPVMAIKEKDFKEPVLITCPFCKKRRKARGIKSHIELKHNIPGISAQDLNDVNEGSRTLEGLVQERLEGKGEVVLTGILTEVIDKDLSSLRTAKKEIEAPEEDPGEVKDPEQVERPEEIKEDLKERRKLNLMPPFSLFDRRKRK